MLQQEAQQLNVKLSEERLKLKELNTQLNQTTQAHNRLEMEQKQGISSMAQIRAKMSHSTILCHYQEVILLVQEKV